MQRFQEILKIPALHKTGRAEDPREEEMGTFLSARAERRRERSLVLAGRSHRGRIRGEARGGVNIRLSHHLQHPRESPFFAGEGNDSGRWVWSRRGLLWGRARAWLSHRSVSRTIANSSAEGVV